MAERRESRTDGDEVDAIIEQWRRERPDLDPSPMLVFGRVARCFLRHRRAQEELLAEFDLSTASFDLLANLRRSGPPHRKTPSHLAASSMISVGGVTFRMDSLEDVGLISRERDPDDRRVVYAQLTDSGRTVIDAAVGANLEREERALASLSDRERAQLVKLLTKLEAAIARSGEGEADDRASR